jgi:Predicted exporters of the RND superfamily
MVSGVSVAEAMNAKEEMLSIDGVKSVVWLDDLLAAYIEGIPESTGLTRAECIQYMFEIFYALPGNAAELDQIALFSALSENLNLSEREDSGKVLDFMFAMAPVLGSQDISQVEVFKPQLEGFFKEGHALFQVLFNEDDYSKKTVKAIGEISGLDYDIALYGRSATTYFSIKTINGETGKAMIYLVVVVLIILFATSSSFWEPILYLATIGAAVLINMGTNLIFGQISYMTQGVGAVLQLALTIDYSIFIINRFKRQLKEGESVKEAAASAVRKSVGPVSASAMTTIAGFVALMFMKYRMGLDMGLVLAKGVVCSMLSAFLFLPALMVFSHKLIEKSEHKTFNLTFKKTSNFLVRTRYFLPFIIMALMLPTAYFQTKNIFTYGSEASMLSKGSQAFEQKEAIVSVFGPQNQLVVLVPKDYPDELKLSHDLLNIEGGVISVQSYSLIDESGFIEALPAEFLGQFVGKQEYNRIILNLSVGEEGAEAEALMAKIKGVLSDDLGAYEGGKTYYTVGSIPGTEEIKGVVTSDYDIISYIALALVGLILIITFKGAVLPVLLLFVIQFSIYVNMTVPYLMNDPMVFIGYLIISNILLGATIDYAILMSSHYMENRRTMGKFDAARHAMAQSSRAILTSTGILAVAGLVLGLMSSMPAVKNFGMSAFRGGVLTFVFVMFLLPQLLMLLDKGIRYTTWKGKKLMIDPKESEPGPEITKEENKL